MAAVIVWDCRVCKLDISMLRAVEGRVPASCLYFLVSFMTVLTDLIDS